MNDPFEPVGGTPAKAFHGTCDIDSFDRAGSLLQRHIQQTALGFGDFWRQRQEDRIRHEARLQGLRIVAEAEVRELKVFCDAKSGEFMEQLRTVMQQRMGTLELTRNAQRLDLIASIYESCVNRVAMIEQKPWPEASRQQLIDLAIQETAKCVERVLGAELARKYGLV